MLSELVTVDPKFVNGKKSICHDRDTVKMPLKYENKEPRGSLIDICQGFAGPQRKGAVMSSNEYKVGL